MPRRATVSHDRWLLQLHGPDRTGRSGHPRQSAPAGVELRRTRTMCSCRYHPSRIGASAGWRGFPTTVVCCGLVSPRLRRVFSSGPIQRIGRSQSSRADGDSVEPAATGDGSPPARRRRSALPDLHGQRAGRLSSVPGAVGRAPRTRADECLANATDRSEYRGRFFSDKAPGMSMLEAPIAAAVGIPTAVRWPYPLYRNLWPARALSAGLAFMLCAFLVGRVTEGLAPGCGGISLVTAVLGTLLAPLAIANFDHVLAAALGLGAFLLAWRRSPHLAGLAAGVALLFEYEGRSRWSSSGSIWLPRAGEPPSTFSEGSFPERPCSGPTTGWPSVRHGARRTRSLPTSTPPSRRGGLRHPPPAPALDLRRPPREQWGAGDVAGCGRGRGRARRALPQVSCRGAHLRSHRGGVRPCQQRLFLALRGPLARASVPRSGAPVSCSASAPPSAVAPLDRSPRRVVDRPDDGGDAVLGGRQWLSAHDLGELRGSCTKAARHDSLRVSRPMC